MFVVTLTAGTAVTFTGETTLVIASLVEGTAVVLTSLAELAATGTESLAATFTIRITETAETATMLLHVTTALILSIAATLLKTATVILLVQSLLEVTVLLETTLLGHLTLVFLALHLNTLGTRLIVFSTEELVLAQLALQGTVIKRSLERRLQTNLGKALLTVAEQPSLVALEGMFQAFANHLVESQEVGS